ncbi:FMN-binding protein [Nonomuraea pusilla]|uniref:FMN-binding protein n=1 Tax=Nonomuraea pusilla TaxID=46177 RepID=UPI003325F3A0
MRRALLAVVVTTIGLVLLLSFKPHDVTAVAQPPSALTQQDSGTGRQPSALTGSDGDGDEHREEHGDEHGDDDGDDDRGTVAAPTPSARKSPSTTSAAHGATGDAVDTRWGPVQVRIAVSGKKITGVDVVQYPDGNRRDREISAVALPTLKEETLSKQSADIDTVSGATYTSEGYIRSLQSAIDRAGL